MPHEKRLPIFEVLHRAANLSQRLKGVENTSCNTLSLCDIPRIINYGIPFITNGYI